MQGRSLERQDQKRKLISWIGVILLLTILLAEVLDTGIQMNVRQAMWRLWYGHQILWQGVRLELGEHYFVFPNHSEKALIVGRFGQNNEMFPDKDILMLSYNEEEANTPISTFALVCRKRHCKSSQERSELINDVKVQCIDLQASFEVWAEREHHSYCQAQGSNITLEYHGTHPQQETFGEFTLFALRAITAQVRNQNAALPK